MVGILGEKEGILAFQSGVSMGALLDSFWEKRGRGGGYRFVHRSNVADSGRKKHASTMNPGGAEGGEALWGPFVREAVQK